MYHVEGKFLSPVWWQKWKILAHVLVFVCCIIAVSPGISAGGWLIFLLIVGLMSLQFLGLFSLMHEACHGHLHPQPHINDILGRALGILLFTSFRSYRICHLRHHSHLRTHDDPQEVVHLATSRPLLAALLIAVGILGAPVFLWIRVPITAIKKRQYRTLTADVLLSIVLYAALFEAVNSSQSWALLSSVGLAIVVGSLNDLVYHQGLPVVSDLHACSSLNSDVFGQMFLSGANRHAEHHAYPRVPGPRLPQLSKELRDEFIHRGAVYDRGFIVVLCRRLLKNPFFLPRT